MLRVKGVVVGAAIIRHASDKYRICESGNGGRSRYATGVNGCDGSFSALCH
jgi:hypothetical protein